MGAKPPTELWVSKADRLKYRVGGLIDNHFLDKANKNCQLNFNR